MPLAEVAASLYAWDVADEGVDRCLDNLQSRAGCNSAYLVGLMHEEKRPLYQRHYPHNPVRKYYIPEDSRAYWRPDRSRYGRISPLTSERPFLKGTDWLQVLVDAARTRDMRTGCEISHTIIDAERLEERYLDVVQRNVLGEVVAPFDRWGARRGALPCLNNESVREYLVSLFVDLASNYDLDFIQTCLVLFGSGTVRGHALASGDPSAEWWRLLTVATGGCFCRACMARADRLGLDWDEMRREATALARIASSSDLEADHEGQLLAGSDYTATALLVERPAFCSWLRFRAESVTEVFEMIRTALLGLGRPVEFRYNTYRSFPELGGLDFRSAFRWVGSVRESDYSEQQGTLAGIETKRRRLLKARRALGYDKPLIAAIGVRPSATPEVIRAGVRVAVETGCDGLSLGHYDGATMERLEAVEAGIAAAEGTEASWVVVDHATS